LACAALLPVIFFGAYFSKHLRTMRKLNLQLREAVEGHTSELDLDEEAPPETRELVNTASEMLIRSQQRQDELNSNLASATSVSTRDRTRFTTMIGELAQGVMVCDVHGKLLLFNSRARDLLGEESNQVELGGSIFQLFDQELIKHGLSILRHRLNAGELHARAVLNASSHEGTLVRVQMAPVVEGAEHAASPAEAITGFILTLDDVTLQHSISTRRDLLLQSLTRETRNMLTRLRTGLDSLSRTVESRQHSGLVKALGRDVRRHCEHLERLSFQQSDLLEQTWPLEPILASDLLTAINQRLGREHNTELPLSAVLPAETWVRADGFAMVQGFSAVVQTLARDYESHVTSLSARADKGLLMLSLHWGDGTLRQEDFRALAMASARRGNEASSASLLELLQRHSGRAWLEESRTGQNLRVALPLCEPPVLGSNRGDQGAYDFGDRIEAGSIRVPEPPLATQVCTAVGLLALPSPSGEKTDGQMSLAAVRLVDGSIQSTARTEFETQWLNSPDDEAGGPDPLALARFSEGTVVALHDAERTLSKLGHVQREVLESANIADTASMARLAMPMADGFSLYLIAEQLGIEPRLDSAESIARTTGKVYLRLAKALEKRGIRSYGQLTHATRAIEEQSNASNPYL
ncbi:MAG: hypothetical protein AAF460_06850, partial [Pseudomonadota bacterium]